jgi:nicotinate phosphoribosyltransferase
MRHEGYERPSELGLFTDLYELTMVQAYLKEAMTGTAVFTLFVRQLPEHRNFLLACGLDTVMRDLQQLRFTEADLDYLRSLPILSTELLNWLRAFRFTGDIYAVPEGTPVFANEPLLEVVAPIAQAQMIETFVMNQIQLQTMLASKAVRVVMAADGRSVVDFGARRTHGIDAAVKAARAFYVAGVHSTSNVLAGKLYSIPLAGTMAHSYVQAHDDERDAFRAFAQAFPGTVLLVDTYDTLEGVRRVIELVKRAPDGVRVGAVRLDSGDLGPLARETRRLLDAAGLTGIEIFASSSLDEHAIDALIKGGAPIDGFGVGTSMGVSDDAPALDIAYKLAEYDGTGRTKLSVHKSILPGRKQVFRQEASGQAHSDIIGRAEEHLEGRSLVRMVMRRGEPLPELVPNLGEIRRHVAEELSRLPGRVRSLQRASPPYPVSVSDNLQRHHAHVRASVP